MKQFWNSNLISLEKSNPDLARRLHVYAEREFDQFQVLDSPEGPCLLEQGHMAALAVSEKDLRLPLQLVPFPKISLICGFGLGAGLRTFWGSTARESTNHVLILEPSIERLAWVLGERDFSDVLSDQRLQFFVEANTDSIFSSLFHWLRIPERAFRMTADVVLFSDKVGEKYREYFIKALDEWKSAKIQIRRQFGEKDDSLLGLKYVCENLSLVAETPGIINFKSRFQNIPAVIVSTGPSLIRSLPHLKKIQNKCLIISADASLNILLKHGIVPHLVATLERDLYSKKFFESAGLESEKLKSFLVAYPFIPSEGLASYKGPIVFSYRDYGYFQFFNEIVEKGIIPSSSSVAHFSLNIAKFLNCSEVVLVGQDLAYDPDTFASHAQGIAYEDWAKPSDLSRMKARAKEERLGDVFFVSGNTRDKVPTHSTYYSFLKEFSWEASQCGFPITNATDGGARIPLIPWQPFEDATSGWTKDLNCFDILNRHYKREAGSFKQLSLILDFLSDLEAKLKEILSLTEHSEIFSKLPQDKKTEILRSLRSAQTELMKDTRFVSFVIQNAGMEYLDCENRWATREAKNSLDFTDSMPDIRRWTALCHEVSMRVKNLISSAIC